MSRSDDQRYMRLALRLARRGYGGTSPNPMVGALLVKQGRIIGRGWHHRAGEPHAEIEAIRDAQRHGHRVKGTVLYVTLEPCSTQGRTPPCTEAIAAAKISRVVCGATDPNPNHAGRGFRLLEQAGVRVLHGVLAEECARLNEAFNHWIVHRMPFVTVKAAMTLDGKIATASGQSKWITGPEARARAMELRRGADALLVGINTVLLDDPSLTVRACPCAGAVKSQISVPNRDNGPRRIILDAMGRTPLRAKVVNDDHAERTTIIVSELARQARVRALAKRVNVLVAPLSNHHKNQIEAGSGMARGGTRVSAAARRPRIDLAWLMERLGSENVTSLLVEGGGEVNASFIQSGLAEKIAFFYAPKILGGRHSRRAVAGGGAASLYEAVALDELEWSFVGEDLLLTARLARPGIGISPALFSATSPPITAEKVRTDPDAARRS
jgi:diaminohydroxyphosphoribosylaminopyrimidine deaminase / 5-amino-6-(5-phosphoribosylamino)uracil reductase